MNLEESEKIELELFLDACAGYFVHPPRLEQ